MVAQDLISVLPEILVAIGGFLLLLLPIRSPRLLGFVTLCVLAGALDLKLVWLVQGPFSQAFFYGMLVLDHFAIFFQVLVLVAVGLVVLSAMGYSRQQMKNRRELYALMLLATVGLMLVVGAQHLALVYIGLELVSLLSYLMTGFLRKEALSIEGALKYFLFGSLATGAFVYGISLVYGLTGTMDLTAVGELFSSAAVNAPVLASLTLVLLVVGVGFKLALVPFHLWAPDAYEGAPTPVTAFLSIGPKLAGFAVLARIFLLAFSAQVSLWAPLLAALCVLTMTLGNLAALAQTNVKRLLAYSSIAHAGTMAIGLAVATPLGLSATLYYLLAYLLMNVAAFIGVIAVGTAAGREDLGAFAGLSRREPFLACMITLALLSLAGVPPMAGFFAKMGIFGAAVKAHAYGLALAAALNSVISLFYYAKIIKSRYLDPVPAGSRPVQASRSLRLALALCGAGLLVIGLLPAPWLMVSADALPLALKVKGLPWI